MLLKDWTALTEDILSLTNIEPKIVWAFPDLYMQGTPCCNNPSHLDNGWVNSKNNKRKQTFYKELMLKSHST